VRLNHNYAEALIASGDKGGLIVQGTEFSSEKKRSKILLGSGKRRLLQNGDDSPLEKQNVLGGGHSCEYPEG